ncbi:MAG: efflux RND transporter periplasmic adaptor subunit [Planctomycetota bacterium]|jgi:RND family efflux transporter MFP subunit
MASRSVVAAVAALVGAGGCSERNEFVAPPPPQVTVQAPVVQQVTTYREFTGRTDAVDIVEVRARVKGFLQSVTFEPGQLVRAGDPNDPDDPGDLLFTIEPEPFEAAVSAAKAQVAQREAARALAELTLERASKAHEQGAVTDIELAEITAKLDAATAGVAAADAALKTAQIDLSYTKIYAPISGRISREQVDVGNLVGSGESTLLTTIVQDDPIYVYTEVNERDLLQYTRSGRPRERPKDERTRVLIELADGGRYSKEGEVDFAETRLDPRTGTLQIRAIFPNEAGKLFPGLFVRVLTPDVNGTGEQMLIPEVSILRDLAGSFVLVADEQNIVQRRDIELGPQVDTERIVSAGLEPTDRVIVSGIQRAIPGSPVDPQEAEPGTASEPAPDPQPETEPAS